MTISWIGPLDNSSCMRDGLEFFAVEDQETWLITEANGSAADRNVSTSTFEFSWRRRSRTCDFYLRNAACFNGRNCRFLHSGRPDRSSLQRAIACVLTAYPKEFTALRTEDSEMDEEDLDQLMLNLSNDYKGWYLTRDRVAKLARLVLPSIRKKKRRRNAGHGAAGRYEGRVDT
eukprot:766658-Hanusia_phi.AAC.2